MVRNALQAGEWGNEEKEGKIPFEKGVGFDLTITNEPYAFQVIGAFFLLDLCRVASFYIRYIRSGQRLK